MGNNNPGNKTVDKFQLESYHGDCVIDGMSEKMTVRSNKPKKQNKTLFLNGTIIDVQKSNGAWMCPLKCEEVTKRRYAVFWYIFLP